MGSRGGNTEKWFRKNCLVTKTSRFETNNGIFQFGPLTVLSLSFIGYKMASKSL